MNEMELGILKFIKNQPQRLSIGKISKELNIDLHTVMNFIFQLKHEKERER